LQSRKQRSTRCPSPIRLRFDPAIEIADISFSLLVRVNSVNLFAIEWST